MWVFSRSISTCLLNLHILLECFHSLPGLGYHWNPKGREGGAILLIPINLRQSFYVLETSSLYKHPKFKCIKLNMCNLFLYRHQPCLSWPYSTPPFSFALFWLRCCHPPNYSNLEPEIHVCLLLLHPPNPFNISELSILPPSFGVSHFSL